MGAGCVNLAYRGHEAGWESKDRGEMEKPSDWPGGPWTHTQEAQQSEVLTPLTRQLAICLSHFLEF